MHEVTVIQAQEDEINSLSLTDSGLTMSSKPVSITEQIRDGCSDSEQWFPTWGTCDLSHSHQVI